MSDRARRLTGRWAEVRRERRAALIPYLTAGFPNYGGSRDALRRAEAAGADFLELGLPFSDPLADGPTIQRASEAALAGGMTAGRALALLHEAALRVPVILMSYLNPVLAYGLERFVADAAAAGAAGLLLTDLPAAADTELEAILDRGPLPVIRLIAPTTTAERLAAALGDAEGFVYVISRLGVTGVRDQVPSDLADHVRRVRALTAVPVVVGFGIGSAPQARAAAGVADGVVVGSALVDALAAGGPAALDRVMRELAAALRAAGPPDPS